MPICKQNHRNICPPVYCVLLYKLLRYIKEELWELILLVFEHSLPRNIYVDNKNVYTITEMVLHFVRFWVLIFCHKLDEYIYSTYAVKKKLQISFISQICKHEKCLLIFPPPNTKWINKNKKNCKVITESQLALCTGCFPLLPVFMLS